MMSAALCPHLVQEYFERVSDIVTTYRPQILKQVEYEKIGENLVLRGAIRHEEHHRICQANNLEGQVNQMLVVIQNRMWGLENLLAACMEEHISTWLTQELFRAYTEHLVMPLKRQRDNPICQCVQLPKSMIYRGWVKALKSLDALILKTGTSLGFMKQTIYPTDNMLIFLSDKLAEYTGGDSCSSLTCNQDDLVPYGFAPNASGEVQVAELEDDDINDLISLSETLCIGYQNSSDEAAKEIMHEEEPEQVPSVKVTKVMIQTEDEPNKMGSPNVNASSPRKPITKRKTMSSNKRSSPVIARTRSSLSEHETTDSDRQEQPEENQNKLSRQRELIARLSSPKSKNPSSVSVSLRENRSPSSDSKITATTSTMKQRPRSAEFSFEKTSELTTPTSKSQKFSIATPEKHTVASGKTKGFLRPKANVTRSPTNPSRSSPKSKPTAVAKPNVKSEKTNTGSGNKVTSNIESIAPTDLIEEENQKSEAIEEDPVLSQNTPLFNQDTVEDDEDISGVLPEMSLMMLSSTVLSDLEDKKKSLAYYQLNFDSFSDDE